VLAIALNFCLLHAIGLGAIHAAVRLRSYDCASAGRIGALSLTLNIHLFTSRRFIDFRRDVCTTKATSASDGKPIEDRRSFAQFQKSLSPQRRQSKSRMCVGIARMIHFIPPNVAEAANFYQAKA